MNKPKYLYKSEELLKVYEFVSEGINGRILKKVQYTETGTENVYNQLHEVSMHTNTNICILISTKEKSRNLLS